MPAASLALPLLFLALSMGGCSSASRAPSLEVSAPVFEYTERFGRDCFMMGLCATIFVVDGGRLAHFEERQTPERVLISTVPFDGAAVRRLDSLLAARAFFAAPERVPELPQGVGGRTLQLSYRGAERSHETTIAFDAQEPLPEWAHALAEEVRALFEGYLRR